MFSSKPAEQLNGITDKAEHAVDSALHSTQLLVNATLDDLIEAMQKLRLGSDDPVGAFMQRGHTPAHDSSLHLRSQARRAAETTRDYMQHEPFKAMLMAAATGATLMALVNLIAGVRSRH
jgi:ElaB/YqjD/DUF883 family membrane-anchored ribosome-binding protein